jgi:trans-2-enoyl-CoA reductase
VKNYPTNVEHILARTFQTIGQSCQVLEEEFNLHGGSAEILLIESLVHCLMSADPVIARQYLIMLAEEMSKEDFDEDRAERARQAMTQVLGRDY